MIPPVRVIELKSPTGDEKATRGFGINNDGHVVGQIGVVITVGEQEVEEDHAALWLFSSGFGFADGVHDLTDEAGLTLTGAANDINTHGLVAGFQQITVNSQRTQRAFIWDLDPEDYFALDPFCVNIECGTGGSAESLTNDDPAIVVGATGYPQESLKPPLDMGGSKETKKPSASDTRWCGRARRMLRSTCMMARFRGCRACPSPLPSPSTQSTVAVVDKLSGAISQRIAPCSGSRTNPRHGALST